ncbi:hypothetical protein [Paraburkholderia sp. HP33-1]|uniref:hypothetical protein n=1 Tax=Paraburkholderia sp. HP33-1 TaxID=2883243 RepID=UPI001F42CFFA|nr:hypothetical protein [Paraburkholderia sp. HP33-1]
MAGIIAKPFHPCAVEFVVCVGRRTQPSLEHNERLLLDLSAVGRCMSRNLVLLVELATEFEIKDMFWGE